MGIPANHFILVFHTATVVLLSLLTISIAQNHGEDLKSFGPFNTSYFDFFSVSGDAGINNQALQITPDTLNDDFSLVNRSGRIMYEKLYKLWEGDTNSTTIASFQTSFTINIYRPKNQTAGEGLAFLIAPSTGTPDQSYGQWLGLTNASLNGNRSNQFIAVEVDTFKQDFDINDNHIGLNINSIDSVAVYNLSKMNILIAPEVAANYTIWVDYNGTSMVLDVYIAREGSSKPSNPVINRTVNLKDVLNQRSYFGFAASTGSTSELNCVLKWDLRVQLLGEEGGGNGAEALTLGLAIGIPVFVLAVGLGGLWYYCYRRRKEDETTTLGTKLKSLPGMPREFSFRDLKKATNNFDERLKLGQGGFGIVYKGILPKDNIEVAVKKFSRENMKGIDDFLAELSIINRLRHKHLVRLVGWCHKNGTLLLVYDYMPNGSLDIHLFGEGEKTLSWERRYNIISGVVSALHYLHNEYDQKVVHRDLKASNVMLDSDFNARLGDFGLARAIDNERTSYAELEGVPGTMGYVAPECFHTGKATRESDVFGFGAVVLEVVCSQRPRCDISGFHFLVDWVWTLYREGRILEAVDGRLGQNFVPEQAERLLKLGLACSHPIPSERPKTQDIVQIISGSVNPPYVPPIKPAFVWPMQMDLGSAATTETIPITSSSYYGSGWTPHYLSHDSQP